MGSDFAILLLRNYLLRFQALCLNWADEVLPTKAVSGFQL